LKKIVLFFLKSIVFFFVMSIVLVLMYRFVPVAGTPLMLIREVSSWFDNKAQPIKYNWVSYAEMSPSLSKAVVVAEDAQFYNHWGFDFEAIAKARAYNKTHKKKKGASTITQQTAKNLFLWPQRSWVRKGFEAYFTVLIEALWPKQRILEVYLNIIEMGPGVYGVGAASKEYYKKKPVNLSSSEAALIAAVLPNPRRFKIANPSAYVSKRRSRILARMSPAQLKIIQAPQATPSFELEDIEFEELRKEMGLDEILPSTTFSDGEKPATP
jgi:monofunctional glycosyltransferase